MLSAGSLITYQATIHGSFTDSPDQVIAQVSAALSGDGMTVKDYSGVPASILDVGLASIGAESVPPFQVKMIVQVGDSYGSTDDARSIIDHEFYIAVGALPITSAITDVVSPSGVKSQTGEPGPSAQPGIAGDIGKTIGDTVAGALKGVGSGLGFGGIATILILIVVVVAIGFLLVRVPV